MMSNSSILHNIRILDFTWVLAGPYATRLLADFGAEVIKVQPLLPEAEETAFSKGYYNTWNRNKLGITLNLNKPEGVAIARKLVGISDAVAENFTPRVMATLARLCRLWPHGSGFFRSDRSHFLPGQTTGRVGFFLCRPCGWSDGCFSSAQCSGVSAKDGGGTIH